MIYPRLTGNVGQGINEDDHNMPLLGTSLNAPPEKANVGSGDKKMNENAVWDVLNKNLFFVKDVVRAHEAKTADKFDVVDPQTGDVLLECREPDIGMMTKFTRFLGGDYDQMAPFNLKACIPATGEQVLRLARGTSFISVGGSVIDVFDHKDQMICQMKKSFFSFGLVFRFFRDKKNTIFHMRVRSGFNGYKLLIDKNEVGRVIWKWKDEYADVFKSTKSKYAISIAPEVPRNNVARQILLGFAIAIDRVKK